MSLPRDDLDLIDALVWAGCLSRVAAREVAAQAQPGRVATYIHEKGLAPMIEPPGVILKALLKAEQAAVDVAMLLDVVNQHSNVSGPGTVYGIRPHAPMTPEKCAAALEIARAGRVDASQVAELYSPRVHGQCSCGGSRNAYLSCEVHASTEQPETD